MASASVNLRAREVAFVNSPSKTWAFPNVAELWSYRELLFTLISRELKVRYKQTALGAAWVILQPLLTMIVFTVFFSRLVHIPIGNAPYSVFILAALVPWTYFATTISRLSSGLLEHQALITRTYFPRLIIPLSSLIAGLVDLALAVVVLAMLMAFFRIPPPPSIWAAPLFLAFAVLTSFSVGVWLAALNVEYRDVQQVIPFLMQTWFFATPIFYPAALVRPSLRVIYGLNPMVGVVEGFRWSVIDSAPPPGPETFVALAGVIILLVAGLVYFQHAQRNFADVI
jgi:lipopolysaccharide transport system permease protein